MHGFILEILTPTSWRRYPQLFFRYQDALVECQRSISEDRVRGCRILPVRISGNAVHEQIVPREDVTQ